MTARVNVMIRTGCRSLRRTAALMPWVSPMTPLNFRTSAPGWRVMVPQSQRWSQ